MENNFFDNLKIMIIDDNLDIVLEQLLNYLKGLKNQDFFDTALIITARHNQLKKDIIRNVVTEQSASINKAQIRNNLLGFLNDLSSKVKNIPIEKAPFAPVTIKSVDFEKIIGQISNLKKISWVANIFEVEKSICRIVSNNGFGTGFLIEDGWLLTNNHVISSKEEAEFAVAEFNFQEDKFGKMQKSYSYKLDPSTLITNVAYDFTKVKVLENLDLPPLSIWGCLKISSLTPELNEHVIIIQHPQGGPKQIAMIENKIINLYENYMHYTTDTMPGSSGSPVFNDHWEVIGIHHAGGNMKKNANGEVVFANEAVLINKIKQLIAM